MDITVITVEPADYGVGESDRVTFVGSKYHVSEDGTLHIQGGGHQGNVAAFPRGHWRAVVRGDLCAESEAVVWR